MKDKKSKVTTRIVTNFTPSDDAVTEIVYCGNVTEVKVLAKSPANNISRFKHVGKYQFLDTLTGEVIESKRQDNSQNKPRKLNKSFEKLRCLINKNFQSNINELHVTLTYGEKMEDFDTASKDFKKFWEKLNYKYTDLEYIRIIESQHTGRWHIHVLIKSHGNGYLFLPKEELEKLWGHGYVWVDKMRNNDNIGAYFTAILKNVDLFEKDSEKPNETKFIVKGARLNYYPQGKRFYSYSKGIKKPECKRTTYSEAMKTLNLNDLVYKKAIEILITDDENEEPKTANTVLHMELNSKRKKKS